MSPVNQAAASMDTVLTEVVSMEERQAEMQMLGSASRAAAERSAEETPGDMLPWADPYIARLLRQHQRLTAAAKLRHGRLEAPRRIDPPHDPREVCEDFGGNRSTPRDGNWSVR